MWFGAIQQSCLDHLHIIVIRSTPHIAEPMHGRKRDWKLRFIRVCHYIPLLTIIGLIKFEGNPEGVWFFYVDLTWNDDPSMVPPNASPLPSFTPRR